MKKILIAVAALLLWVAPMRAQTPSPPPQQMHPPMPTTPVVLGPVTSIDALVDKALADSPVIRAAWARVDAAQGNVTQAAARANPELMTERRDAFDGMNSQTAVGVSWPLELGRRQGRAVVAINTAAETALTANEQGRQVAARVRLAAIRALAADRLVTLAQETVESHHQWCDLLAASVAEGKAAPIERDTAEIELKQGQAAVARLRAEAAMRWVDVKEAAGLDPTTPLAFSETLEQAVAAVRKAVPVFLPDVVEGRADVAAADAAIEVAAAKEDLARREGKLDLKLNATYMRTASGFSQFGMNENGFTVPITSRMNEFVIGATVMLPWPNRNQGMIAAAAAEKKSAEYEREQRLLAARAEAAAAEARDREAGNALEIYTGGLLDLSTKNLNVVRQSYQLGRISRIDVTMEERRYRDVQTAYVAALLDAYEARVIWTQALGGSR